MTNVERNANTLVASRMGLMFEIAREAAEKENKMEIKTSVELKDVLQWLDELATELKLPKHEHSFEQYLVIEGAIHKLKGQIQKLDNGRQD